jgi:hypothetical protein
MYLIRTGQLSTTTLAFSSRQYWPLLASVASAPLLAPLFLLLELGTVLN